jgi:hypothetical protein
MGLAPEGMGAAAAVGLAAGAAAFDDEPDVPAAVAVGAPESSELPESPEAAAVGAAGAAWPPETLDPEAAAADVRTVPGISPIYGFLLADAGLGSVGDLAASEVATALAAVSRPGVVAVDEATVAGWIQAAREQVAGPGPAHG